MKRWWWALIALSLSCTLVPTQKAEAAACCMSATANGVGRLLIWEKWAAGIRTSLLHGTGHWNTDAVWHGYDEDYSEEEIRAEAWAMVGIGRKFSVFVRFPWVFTTRTSIGKTEWGNGAADLQFGGRYEILSIGEIKTLPAIAVTLNATAPLGTATHDSNQPLGTDVSTRGAWTLNAGVSIEKTFLPFFLRLDLGLTVPLPMYRGDIQDYQWFGVSTTVTGMAGIEVLPQIVVSLMLRFLWEDNLQIKERRIDNSNRLDMGVGLAVSWRFNPHWTLQLAVDSGIFANNMGDNQFGRLFTSIGLRYGFF